MKRLACILAVFPACLLAGEVTQQRQVERYAESVSFPNLIERCVALASDHAALRDALPVWHQRRAADINAGHDVVAAAAAAQQKPVATIDTAIREQSLARFDAASAEDRGYTCERLGHTLRGDLPLPLAGHTVLDEDSRRELFDELFPVGRQLLQCDTPAALHVSAGPPPLLRPADTAANARADAVEIWTLSGCGKSLAVEVSLRFFPDDPPAYSMAFPRQATPLGNPASGETESDQPH